MPNPTAIPFSEETEAAWDELKEFEETLKDADRSGVEGLIVDSHMSSARRYLINDNLSVYSDQRRQQPQYFKRERKNRQSPKMGALMLCAGIDRSTFARWMFKRERLRQRFLTLLELDKDASEGLHAEKAGSLSAAPFTVVGRAGQFPITRDFNFQYLDQLQQDPAHFVRGNYRVMFNEDELDFDTVIAKTDRFIDQEKIYEDNCRQYGKKSRAWLHQDKQRELMKIKGCLLDLSNAVGGMHLNDGFTIKAKRSLGFYYSVGFPKTETLKQKKHTITIPRVAFAFYDAASVHLNDVYEPMLVTDGLGLDSQIPIFQMTIGDTYFVYMTLRDIQTHIADLEQVPTFLHADWLAYARRHYEDALEYD